MTFKSAAEICNKNAAKKATITGWPILDLNPLSPYPCLSCTQKSRALCSVAAEVQMVCLYASLTQCCSFSTLSISAPPPSPLSPLHFPLCTLSTHKCLVVLCSSVSLFLTHFWSSLCPVSPVALTHTFWLMSNLVALYSAILVRVR